MSDFVKFPYYSANAYEPNVLGQTTLTQFLNAHKNPNPDITKLFKDIKEAAESGDLKKKNELKKGLFSFTPSVEIDKGLPRQLVNVKSFTGLMQMDFDKLESTEDAIDLKNHVFENCDSIVCAYLSPSRLGVKCLLRIKVPGDLEQFRRLHYGMVKEFECYSYLDLATKNAVLPLFLSHDKDILIRNFDRCSVWSTEVEEEKFVQPTNYKPMVMNGLKQRHYYEKTTRIFSDKINAISSDGHPQLLSACLVLGTRVGAGYLDQHDAEQLAAHLISNNSYLKKGVYGYVKTSKWGLLKGMETPKEYRVDL